MNKIYSFLTVFFVSVLALGLASCTQEYEYDGMGAPDTENKGGVYFPSTNQSVFEVEPTDAAEFTVEVARVDTDGALEVPLTVTVNDGDVFKVPATAVFADQQEKTEVTITFADAEVGVGYNVAIEVPNEYVYIYKQAPGYASYKANASRIKWEKIGTGYFVGGFVANFFAVSVFPLAVEIEKAVTSSATKFRFDSPYAYAAYNMDEIGYYGYPYNSPGTYDDQAHRILIEATADGVFMNYVDLGIDLGYGMFSTGSICGNLVNPTPANLGAYPWGTYYDDLGYIEFPKSSLFVSMAAYNDGGAYIMGEASQLFLSAEAYVNYMASLPQE